jgi:signal transduction histidine kinase
VCGLIQTLWDQMRAELRVDVIPQMDDACRALLSGTLGPLTENQREDLESVERSMVKLSRRVNGESINWADYSEAAHALRGPLNSTLGFSRLMLKGVDGPITSAQGEALETIYDASRRMLALFNLLLDALILKNQDMGFEIESVSATEVLDELISLGQTLARNRNFAFDADVNPSISAVKLQGNNKRLRRALSALLALSGKYMGDGVLTLRAWTGEATLLIRLKSQGCRLPAELLSIPSTLLTDEADCSIPYDAHLRLGLAWHILNKMGARLEAEQTDETCIFTVALPAS